MDTELPSSTDATGSIDRSQWPVRKGRLTELEREEQDLSATTTASERFAVMWQLAQDAWAVRGEPIAERAKFRAYSYVMPAKNIYHDAVIAALETDGWTITDDPLRLSYGGKEVYVDLAAERESIAAEKDGKRIAVEIQSFLSPSPLHDLQAALGQVEMYRAILEEKHSDRVVYLAVPFRVFESLLAERFGQMIMRRLHLRVLVFDAQRERIVQWIESD